MIVLRNQSDDVSERGMLILTDLDLKQNKIFV